MEVVLTAYYRGDSTGLATDRLDVMRGQPIATTARKGIPHNIEIDTKHKRKAR